MKWASSAALAALLITAGIQMSARSSDGPVSSLRTAYVRPASVPRFSAEKGDLKKALLGRRLFFDPILSRNHDMACATCHRPERGWTDGNSLRLGSRGTRLKRRVPTIWNLAWEQTFFWDGREKSLESQAIRPIENPDEMGLPIEKAIERLERNEIYRSAFAEIYPDEGVTANTVVYSLAAFERTVISQTSRFDRWVDGEDRALTKTEKLGLEIFNGKGECVRCHTGWRLTNGSFADTGLKSQDRGRGAVTGEPVLEFAFKTPTLRDVARRAPYMHDGSLPTLEAVIEFYDRGGDVAERGLVPFIRPLRLKSAEKRALLDFLKTLTEERSFDLGGIDSRMTASMTPGGGL